MNDAQVKAFMEKQGFEPCSPQDGEGFKSKFGIIPIFDLAEAYEEARRHLEADKKAGNTPDWYAVNEIKIS